MSDFGQGGGFGGGQPPGGGGFGGGQPPGGGGFGGGQPPGGGGFGQPPGGQPPGGGGFGQPPGSGGGAPPSGGGMGGGGGEGPLAHIPFTPDDEANLSGMARFAMIAAITAIIAGFLQAIAQIVQSVVIEAPGPTLAGQACGAVLGLGITGTLAFFLFKASTAIKKVVETDDADQQNLVAALSSLKVYFMVKGILVIIGLCFVCCIAGLAMFGVAAIAGSV